MTAPGTRSPATDAIPEALIGRFKEALARLWDGEGRFGLAVSGGPDSLALLALSDATFPGRFEVATVDHGLRAESAQECAMVARVCAERGIPCAVLKVTVARGNVQSRAREARYGALMDWADARGVRAIATAHHADDQAETLLMRLNRGSGVAGLAGVREWNDRGDRGATVIRPLLGFRRAELAEVVRRAGLTAVTDPSNADDRFDRARIRKAMAASDWLDPLSFATSAANLAEAEEAVAWAAQREWDEQASCSVEEVRYRGHFDSVGHMRRVPAEVVVRIVERAIGYFGRDARRSEIARLIKRLENGENGNLAGVLATVESGQWVFRPEPPRRAGS